MIRNAYFTHRQITEQRMQDIYEHGGEPVWVRAIWARCAWLHMQRHEGKFDCVDFDANVNPAFQSLCGLMVMT